MGTLLCLSRLDNICLVSPPHKKVLQVQQQIIQTQWCAKLSCPNLPNIRRTRTAKPSKTHVLVFVCFSTLSFWKPHKPSQDHCVSTAANQPLDRPLPPEKEHEPNLESSRSHAVGLVGIKESRAVVVS